MGTGIVSILLNGIPYNGSWSYWLSIIVFALNVLLFAIFALRRGEDLPEESKVKPSQLLSLTYLIASLFVICFVFYIVLAFRAVKG